jgi:hypothetical protein
MRGASHHSTANDVVRLKSRPAFVQFCVKICLLNSVGSPVVAGCQCACKEAYGLLLEGIPYSGACSVCSDGFIW